ncbi:MAG: triose-phosphate isomerase [Candidatus Jacksonbacteria bacterium RIFOXYD2_FULL_43_21]|nr:MAG: triose-phosphate isomerase [Candidatus Jacksonbacteria bacterium RIFOXYA2_FULL_43_12]OGY79716.1 MAG: triose-phosphate isomerase [Candidatus Jacksonbacteria bacterium RIFOXYD2_FULL_43_21]HCC50181.1 triose-phosphate isomerase [Candidatus Jacksonbacteria bacterium]HCR14655.1 triose-phosphate isomerase [Candidatus Jacksonbacteria bacterium]
MKYIIANWKIKLAPVEEIRLAKKIIELAVDQGKVKVSINPSFLSLWSIAQILENTPFYVGAQNCFWVDNGAYTGEISPEHLKSVGCHYVLIGHSERRSNLGESSTMINKKIRCAIDNGLVPILCVGENDDERRSGSKDHIIRREIEMALQNVNIVGTQKLLIAYEPIWAIGTGQPATVQEIVYMHKVIRQTLVDLLPDETAKNNAFILYGGSVDSANVSDFLRAESVDGVLVGTASVDYKQFAKILEIANNI